MNKHSFNFLILGANSKLALSCITLLLNHGNVYAFSRSPSILKNQTCQDNYHHYTYSSIDDLILQLENFNKSNLVYIDFRVLKVDSLIIYKTLPINYTLATCRSTYKNMWIT